VELILEERARELGADIQRGHEVIEASQDDEGVNLQFRGSDGVYETRASYLVGCDGGHSVVRKSAGVAFPGTEPTLIGRMGDVRVPPAGLDKLRREIPELGGKDFGIVRTKTGNFAIVPLGNGVHRVAAIEWDQAPLDRAQPMPLDELQSAIQRVTGIDLPMSDPTWLSRPTDNSRLADQYRRGRILLAGDAAHVHWAYGGMGLQTGLQDAGNLGWKLAAQVQGWAPKTLLDTYHSERHPVGQRLLMSTRAQEVLAQPGEHVTALRELIAELLHDDGTRRHIVDMITSVEVHYPMAGEERNRQRLIGRWAPDLPLVTAQGKTRVAELMHQGKGVFLELASREDLRALAAQWQGRINCIAHRGDRFSEGPDALLIRPDGYVAWAISSTASKGDGQVSLASALESWFGEIPNRVNDR
jgi:2-polyprenyl-6-methoxyphenol hydroxylase-like FAD-dependent oxidoreductase